MYKISMLGKDSKINRAIVKTWFSVLKPFFIFNLDSFCSIVSMLNVFLCLALSGLYFLNYY